MNGCPMKRAKKHFIVVAMTANPIEGVRLYYYGPFTEEKAQEEVDLRTDHWVVPLEEELP
jgi:hypothetical protein